MENLFRQVDGYCERIDPSYWAEPINAVTNAAFLIAALWMWRRVEDGLGRALCLILGAIGAGSFLFHTHATVWAAILDVVPILLFVLVYIYAANRWFWGLPIGSALGLTFLYLPYSYGVSSLVSSVPFFAISAQYWPLPLLIAAYGVALRARHRATGTGLLIGAALLCLSLTARSIDELFCDQVPIGTHFLWHIFNGLMLGWMIEVYRRHMLAVRAVQG